jgi:hypothetical protein
MKLEFEYGCAMLSSSQLIPSPFCFCKQDSSARYYKALYGHAIRLQSNRQAIHLDAHPYLPRARSHRTARL